MIKSIDRLFLHCEVAVWLCLVKDAKSQCGNNHVYHLYLQILRIFWRDWKTVLWSVQHLLYSCNFQKEMGDNLKNGFKT